MRLIAGLGNPGAKYLNNRHNVGFLLLDKVAESRSLKFKKKIKYDYLKLNDLLLIKPKTFMNRSGDAVTSVLTDNRLQDILVIVDDINIPLGEIRLRRAGGFGGHNGLKSIGNALGTDNFKRMRIGVGSPKEKGLSEYVLSNFSQEEDDTLQVVFDFALELLQEYCEKDFDQMVETYSKIKKSYSEEIEKTQDQNRMQN